MRAPRPLTPSEQQYSDRRLRFRRRASATALTQKRSRSGTSAPLLKIVKMGPQASRSTVLSAEEETLIVAFRRRTLLPLDDCLYALQATIQRLTRSSAAPPPSAPCSQSPANRRRHSGGLRRARSGTSTSISPRSGPNKDGCTCSWLSIASRNSPSQSSISRRLARVAAEFLRRLVERVPYVVHTV